MLNNSARPSLPVIACCYAQRSAGELWRYSQTPRASGCTEGNQLWQSCKLFPRRAKKGSKAHSLTLPPYLYQGPVSSYGPFICQNWKPPASQYHWHGPQKRCCLGRWKREKRWREGEGDKERREGEQRISQGHYAFNKIMKGVSDNGGGQEMLIFIQTGIKLTTVCFVKLILKSHHLNLIFVVACWTSLFS